MSEVVSGGLILETSDFTLPFSTVTLPIIETFTVADAPPSLYGDYPWASFMGPVGWKVTGQTAHLTGQGFSTLGERLNVDLGTNDYTVTAQYPLWSPDTSGFLIAGPLARQQGTSEITFYAAVLISGTPTTLNLYRFLSGAQTLIGGPFTVTPHTNMTVAIRTVGNLISAAFDGVTVIGPVSDANIPSGRYAGLEGVAPGLNAVKIDNVAITAPSVATHRRRLLNSLTPLTGVR